MPRKKLQKIYLLFILLVPLIFGVIILKQSKNGTNVKGATSKTLETSVSASIGEYRFFLYGYTSPQAKVKFEGIGIYDETYANKEGYFEFANRFSPLSPREACLTSQDQFGRLSNPLCLPPFPIKYDTTIGPVILPPTLSLDKQYYFVDQEVLLTGQTLPNSKVDIALYVDDRNTFVNYLVRIARPVEAFSFPELQARSDSKGNFSISIPSSNADIYRLFSQTNYNNDPSGKSNTLYLKILPVWMFLILLIQWLWEIIKSRLIELIILAEILFVAIYFLRRYFHPHPLASSKALALRPSTAIIEV